MKVGPDAFLAGLLSRPLSQHNSIEFLNDLKLKINSPQNTQTLVCNDSARRERPATPKKPLTHERKFDTFKIRRLLSAHPKQRKISTVDKKRILSIL
jgi:hypothetical protein